MLACLLATLAFTGAAHAADLTIQVRNSAGKPQADAVVMIYPAARVAEPPRLTGPYRMVQKNMMFNPFTMIVPVGAEVTFPNLDTVRHHVYSFSAAHPFELKLYGKDESRAVKFDKAGVIAIGCNIHDAMVAFIRVVDTPYAAKTDAAGKAIIRNLPDGAANVKLWHPYLKAANNEIARTLNLPGASSIDFTVDLRPAPMTHDY
jgi:plastocyanin